MANFEYATVVSTSPLQIVTDADSVHPVPARTVSSYSPIVGDRVRIELLTPLAPRIQSRV